MNGFYELVIAKLKEAGFKLMRSKGSHQTWSNGSTPVTVSTNCHSRHTANAIMKEAGLAHRF